ncbi:oxidase [Pseudohalocynthiibacter aestuariivivens]|uniref:Oxidase n=1 Tax=Roseovarius pelagicus TaxID=2980108 RepID=A0ABY6D7K5_9RHOB|nr:MULTISPECIES: oxidase [Rhodobacterales]QIE45928.1 oxidase [Pseudohalocynthiibacter aestuariivivens]UXX82117.1 hypothetical protein N7U68_13500 [Roseovarius pelagicus]
MSRFDGLKAEFTAENFRRFAIYCCIPAVIFYLVSLAAMGLGGFTLVETLRDPAQITKQSSFLGFVSSIGAWLWVAAATVCFFRIAAVTWNDNDPHRMLLVLCGWFSAFLAVDDFFLIHDRFITEGILIPLYALFVGYLLRKYYTKIKEIDAFAFLMAGGMLAMSVLVDAVQEILPISYGLSQALEEGFKFVGAASWFYFCYRIAAYRLTGAVTGQSQSPSASE